MSDNDEPIVFTKETLEEKHSKTWSKIFLKNMYLIYLVNPLLDTGIPVGNPGYPNSGNLVLEVSFGIYWSW